VLKEGDKAPSFSLDSDEGGRVSLRDFTDRTLVLYFYPRDNTPGCTREAQAFTAARAAIETAGGAVVGVSRDSLKSHESFRTKCQLGITLVSDPDLSVHKAYGAWGTKTMYGKKIEGVLRTTFLVQKGKIARIFPNVKVDGHADAVIAAIGELSSGGPSSMRIPTMPPKGAPAKKAAPAKKPAPAKKLAPVKKPAAKKAAPAKKPAAKTAKRLPGKKGRAGKK
jgi:peroxiredoxin Q/BCP